MAQRILDLSLPEYAISGTEPTITTTEGEAVKGPDCQHAGSLDVGGTPIWAAGVPNTRPQAGYRGTNSDRAVAIALGASVENPVELLEGAFEAARVATEKKRKEIINTEQGTSPPKQEGGAEYDLRGGTTGIAVLYDPAQNTLDLRAIGDSLAFIVFHDGKKGVTLQINDFTHGKSPYRNKQDPGGKVYSLNQHWAPIAKGACSPLPLTECYSDSDSDSYLNFDWSPDITFDFDDKQPSQQYSIEGQLRIDELKSQICEHHHLNPKTTTATLVVASDGVETTYLSSSPWATAHKSVLNDIVQQALDQRNTANPALTVATLAAKRYHSENSKKDRPYHDDCTVMLMPLGEGNKSNQPPVLFFLADGMMEYGQPCAHAAVAGFRSHVENHLNGPSQTVDNAELSGPDSPSRTP